jgi:hypothetical protein
MLTGSEEWQFPWDQSGHASKQGRLGGRALETVGLYREALYPKGLHYEQSLVWKKSITSKKNAIYDFCTGVDCQKLHS